MLQNAFAFLARVVGEKGQNNLTQHEKDQGVEIKWLPIDEIIKMFDKDPEGYIPKFIKQRELTFLTEAKKMLDI